MDGSSRQYLSVGFMRVKHNATWYPNLGLDYKFIYLSSIEFVFGQEPHSFGFFLNVKFFPFFFQIAFSIQNSVPRFKPTTS